jgi:hypothetical protein
MNGTLEKMWPLWFRNMAYNTDLDDIEQIPICDRLVARVVVLGTGASAIEFRDRYDRDIEFRKSTLLVGNQSSHCIGMDMMVLTDGQDEVPRKIRTVDTDERMRIAMANIVHPACKSIPCMGVWGFKHVVNAGENPELKAVNAAMSAIAGKSLKTWVIQVGMSLNAAILIVDKLMAWGKIPNVPIILAGVDLSYKDMGSFPVGQPSMLSDTGKITTPVFLEYARNLSAIVSGLPDRCIRLYAKYPWMLTADILEVGA